MACQFAAFARELQGAGWRAAKRASVYIGVALAVLASGVAFAPSAHAGGCLKDARQIKLSAENILRLDDYLCRSDRDPQARVRVQFQRLSGLAAGAVLKGGAAPWLSTLYGKFRVVRNDVLDEYNNLIARFGSAERAVDGGGGESISVMLQVGTEAQVRKGETETATGRKGDQVRSFSLSGLPEFPLVDEMVHILNQQTWPDSLSMYYTAPGATSDPASPLDEMTVWRYLKPDDLRDYSSRLQRYNALVTDREFGTKRVRPKSVQLLEYLTAGGWPEHFVHVEASLVRDQGCITLDFKTGGIAFVVEVAVIENVSSKALQIEQLVGELVGGKSLRKVTPPTRSASEATLSMQAFTVAPRERLVVPLAIVLAGDDPSSPGDAETRARSDEAFRKIAAKAPGTLFRTEVLSSLRGNTRGENDMFVVRKLRESFKPPAYPEQSDYAFGPEWRLAGLQLGGERILFDKLSSNFIALTADTGVGSCPILYAWDRDAAQWVRHGKIIHKAQTRERLGSETIVFSGLVDRFRIAEEELERATLHEIRLQIDLTNGRTVSLLPDQGTWREAGGVFAELHADESIEITFTLPADVRPDDVVRSSLTVTGYYDRYAALLVTRLERGDRRNPGVGND